MRTLLSACAIASGFAMAQPAPAQSIVHEVWGPTQSFGFGVAVDTVGDVNLDGIPDYIVTNTTAYLTQAPAATIRSGATGTALGSVQGPSIPVAFGASLATGGDLDQDGVPDFIIGSPFGTAVGQTKLPYGSAYVYSGATQQPIRQDANQIPGDYFGTSVFFIDDLTGDSVADYAVHADYFELAPDTVDIYSGATGQWIRQHVAFGPHEAYGQFMCGIGDLDGDAVSDYSITSTAASQTPASGSPEGAVAFYSGSNGAQIATHWGTALGTTGYGWGIEAVGDLDGDGKPDYATSDGGNSLLLISGASGAVITRANPRPQHALGPLIERTKDLDGDGFGDVLVSEYGTSPAALAIGSKSAEVLFRFQRPANANPSQIDYPRDMANLGDVDQDGSDEWVLSNVEEQHPQSGLAGNVKVLSTRPLYAQEAGGSGSAVDLEINSGVPNAGSPYLVLASATGTGGISFGGETIPLTYDIVTVYSILAYNTAVFANTLATTDSAGNAVATFDTSYVPASLQGKTFWFAYIGLAPGGHFVSNAEPIPTSAN